MNNPQPVDVEQCHWHDMIPCQFKNLGVAKRNYNGRSYCTYHLPSSAPGAPTVEDVSRLIRDRKQDLRGIHIPAGNYEFQGPAWNLSHCVFNGRVKLNLQTSHRFDFDDSRFVDDLSVKCETVVSASWRRVCFRKKVKVEVNRGSAASALDWNFAGSTFEGPANFEKADFAGSLNISDVTFLGPLSLDGTKFPQLVLAHRLKVERNAIDEQCEGSYRAAREAFSKLGNRELEGKFYAWEKRAQRSGMSWNKPSSWIPRIVSSAYDIISGYGHSYEQALLSFLMIQLVFAFSYSIYSGRIGCCAPYSSLLTFSLAQLAKPFELLTARDIKSQAFVDVLGGDSASTTWILLTTAHSILSLVTLALFVLALRWRFRRA